MQELLRAQERPATLILTVTSGLHLSKAEHFSLIVLLLVSSSKPEPGVSVGDRK